MTDQRVAVPFPGTLWNLTYFRKIPKRAGHKQEYTYTSEIKDIRSNAAHGEEEKEYLARVDPNSDHIGHDDPAVFD